MKRITVVGILCAFATMFVLGMAASPAFPSGFAGNSLTGTGGMKIMGAAGGTKLTGTVFVEYYDYNRDVFTDPATGSTRPSARGRVAVRLSLNNSSAMFYCDDYDPADGTYCYNGTRFVNGVQHLLSPILVPTDDIPMAQTIITNAIKALILNKFFGGNQTLGIYLKAVTNGVDTVTPLFQPPTPYCSDWFNPGCTSGIWPQPYDPANIHNIFMFDVDVAVK